MSGGLNRIDQATARQLDQVIMAEWADGFQDPVAGHLGRRQEARDATADLLRQQPKFSRRLAEKKLYFVKRPEQLRLYLDGLRKAGLQE